MRWLKRDMWKAGIALAGMLLPLVLMVWVPVSAAGTDKGASGLATPVTVTVQTTPTVDATATALNKEKLAQEVQQLKNQNAPTFFDWLRGNVSILLLGLGALAGFLRWLADRQDAQDKELRDQQDERKKRAEERFQAAVTGLGEDKEGVRVSAAITLRAFLYPDYEQFYTQIFDLAVANLRLPRTASLPQDPNTPLPLTSLSQALSTIFKEAFRLARDQQRQRNQPYHMYDPLSLDATGIQLDNTYIRGADLKNAWMPRASLRKVDFSETDLSEANLSGAVLRGTNLYEVDGLTKEQLEACRAKDAIIDEDPTTSSSQLTVSLLSSSQSNDVQAQSASSAQVNTSTPDTDESSATSSSPSGS